MSIPRRDAGPVAARALACQANPPRAISRLALGAVLLAGTAACTSAPQYPIYAGERPGDGSIIATQPAYPISARDAQQNAADRASQNGYPAYGAPPVAGPQAPVYAPPAPNAPPVQDDAADDAPHGLQSAPVDSSDLPPPSAPPSSDAPPPPPPPPQAETIAYDGGQLVFGTDSVTRPRLVFAVEDGAPPPLDLVAYRHRRHPAEASADTAASDPADAKPPPHARHRHGAAAKSEAAASDTPAADTPYQTVVKPGEKLSDVAERTHSSREALAALNDVKHPRHVKPGTVLKVPYRYTYEVQKGDTLYTISHRFNQDPAAMAKLNSLKAVPTLQPGETIQLPPTAEDTGKRDHASAAGPSPVAAPEKLADAALAKETRHGRHRHTEAAVTASADTAVTASPATPPAKLSRAERRRLLREQKAAAVAAAAPAEATPTASEAQPAKLSRAERRRLRREEKAGRVASAAAPAYTPPSPALTAAPPAYRPSVAQAAPSPYIAPSTSSASATSPPPTLTPAGTYPSSAIATGPSPRTSSPPTGASSPPRTYPTASAPSSAVAAAGATTTQPYYAGTRPYTAPAATASTGAPYRAAAGSGVAASTYAMPGYAARGPSAATTAGASRVASLTAPSYSPSYTAGGASTGGYAPSLGRARPATPAASGIAGLTPTQIAAAGRGRFIWPLRGQLISGFGDKGTGQHNDGVDIAATPGSGVRAAAAGEVVYAGSSIPGFGNLVLVKHSGGWVTAYAHLDRIEVRMRDSVAQGDELGQAGQTGAVDRPQLHFEVRYAPDPTEKARPVDPTLVLPAG